MSDSDLIIICGWLATTWLAYRWGLRSQRLHRDAERKSAIMSERTDFIGFLQGWKYSFGRKIIVPGGWEYDHRAFFDEIPTFLTLCERIRASLPLHLTNDFDSITKGICNTEYKDFYSGRFDRIVKQIDDLICVIRNA